MSQAQLEVDALALAQNLVSTAKSGLAIHLPHCRKLSCKLGFGARSVLAHQRLPPVIAHVVVGVGVIAVFGVVVHGKESK